MIRKEELVEISSLKGLSVKNTEKDYLIDVCLHMTSRYRDALVFKGGTALYKFHNLNRFSEDLDFTLNKKRSATICDMIRGEGLDITWTCSSRVDTINKELAVNFGKLVFVDTGAAKKLGDYRAFEMFAFFSESTATQKVWWAEYCRWTDHDGYGFLASIIGDTIEMKQNYATYKTFLDSISVSRMHTEVLWREKVAGLRVSRDQSPRSPPDHDLLGRSIPSSIKKNNQVLVGKKIQQCQIR